MNWEIYIRGTAVKQQDLCNDECLTSLYKAVIDGIKLEGPLLDMGSGSSPKKIPTFCKEKNIDYYGCDLNGEGGITICDMHELPYDDDLFKTVLSFNSLEHAACPVIVFGEVNRILKNQGMFVIGLPRGVGHDISSEHYINLTRNQVHNLCTHFGFILVREEKIGPMEFFYCMKIRNWKEVKYK